MKPILSDSGNLSFCPCTELPSYSKYIMVGAELFDYLPPVLDWTLGGVFVSTMSVSSIASSIQEMYNE